MKKKILFALTFVTLLCVFSITALAADTVLETDELGDIHTAIANAQSGEPNQRYHNP